MKTIIIVIVILLVFLLCLLFIHGADDETRADISDEEQMRAISYIRGKETGEQTEEPEE